MRRRETRWSLDGKRLNGPGRSTDVRGGRDAGRGRDVWLDAFHNDDQEQEQEQEEEDESRSSRGRSRRWERRKKRETEMQGKEERLSYEMQRQGNERNDRNKERKVMANPQYGQWADLSHLLSNT